MTAYSVQLGNTLGRLDASQPVIRSVRDLVAYQEVRVPPPKAQAIIKAFFAHYHPKGDSDLDALFEAKGNELMEAGLDPETFTPAVLSHVLHQRGIWDGWNRMMAPDGQFPAGLLQHVQRALWRLGHHADVQDARERVELRGPVGTEPPLFDYQRDALEAALARTRGVIDLPPRSGKTRIAAAIICRLGLPTLYVTPRVELVRQTVEELQRWLPANHVIPLTGGAADMGAAKHRKMLAALVWVATPMTAAGRGYEGISGIRSRSVLLVDEFHHSSASSYQAISNAAMNAYWRFGMTGTFYRADGADMEMHGVLAEPVYARSIAEMVALGRLVPARVALLRLGGHRTRATGREARDGALVDHKGRNEALAGAARALAVSGRRVLVLTQEIRHSEVLASMIPGAVQVDGRDNSQVRGALDALEAHRIPAVVGTSVIGEGVDVPAADALVYAAGGKSPVKVVQDVFRVLTAHTGKRMGLIVDCADDHNDSLLRHAAGRLAIYRREPSFRADVIGAEHFGGWLAEAGRE